MAGTPPTDTRAIIYWTVDLNGNAILDQGEHAVLTIVFNGADRPASLDTIRAEAVLPQGATLTVERGVPNITASIMDLG